METFCTKKKLGDEDALTVAVRIVRAWAREIGPDRLSVARDVTLLVLATTLEALLLNRQATLQATTLRERATLARAGAQIAKMAERLIRSLPVPRGKMAPTLDDIIAKTSRRRRARNQPE